MTIEVTKIYWLQRHFLFTFELYSSRCLDERSSIMNITAGSDSLIESMRKHVNRIAKVDGMHGALRDQIKQYAYLHFRTFHKVT